MNDNPHQNRADLREVGAQPARHEEPLALIAAALTTKRSFCDLLETIADSLPEPSRLICLRAARIMRSDLPLYFADEGRCLLPQLRARHSGSIWIMRMLDQVAADHAQLEGAIDEVADLLERIGAGKARQQERIVAGYALRCFFEGLRRHIGWEQKLILPMAEESLTAEDLLVIAEGIRQNRKSAPDRIPPKPHPHVEQD